MDTRSGLADRLGLVLAAALVTAPAPLLAQRAPGLTGAYLTVDAGVNFADDLVVHGYPFSISQDTGFRTDVSGGYAFRISEALSFAVEGELGVLSSSLSHVDFGDGTSGPTSGHLTQVPLLANGVFNWAMGPRWVGYAGAGLGVDRVVLSDSDYYTLAAETDFAWQAQAGVRVRLGIGYLTVGYRYLSVSPEGLRPIGNDAFLGGYTFSFR